MNISVINLNAVCIYCLYSDYTSKGDNQAPWPMDTFTLAQSVATVEILYDCAKA